MINNKMKAEEFKTIPLAREDVNVSKVVTKGNTYRLSKKVDIETKTEQVELLSENVRFKEIEKNEYIDDYPDTRTEGNILIIPVVKEIEIVTKQLVLVKEVHVEKTVINAIHDVEYDIKSEHLEISKTDVK